MIAEDICPQGYADSVTFLDSKVNSFWEPCVYFMALYGQTFIVAVFVSSSLTVYLKVASFSVRQSKLD